MTATTLDTLITGITPAYQGELHRDDAYAVVLGLLDHCRAVNDNATTDATELWQVLQTIPGWENFGGRGRLHQLLHTAESDAQLRRAPGGVLLVRLDAPDAGGPEHVWVRLEGRSRAEVEVIGADPWPSAQLHAPGPAWWRCTGCRANSGIQAADFEQVRDDASEHAADCRALPAPAHRPTN
ncbi:hypothetical protein [Streptacidiphilus anmyonensis]|uniref:hypothetical protein n=1 Tax=Streptacidiphilus anmyonensis TaxID=405782 RepID=UPI0005A60111|nr:hypothetical protein [Streptacidiphilus anmyonensis]